MAVVPACAGVILKANEEENYYVSSPRVCGGDPAKGANYIDFSK